MYKKMLLLEEMIAHINDALLASRQRLLLFAFGVSVCAAAMVSFYTWFYLTHSGGLPYDVDNWGHLIAKMRDSGATWSLLTQAYQPERGLAVPFLFGLSYCLIGIPESVHLLNILLQTLSVGVLVLLFATTRKNPLIGAVIALAWSAWPPTSYVYGYYYSEPLLGLMFLLIWFAAARLLQTPRYGVSMLLGGLMALIVYVKTSTQVMIFLLFLFAAVLLYRAKRRAMIGLMFGAFLCLYLLWPLYSYTRFQRVLPMTLNSGYVLQQGTYLPGDDMNTSYLRKIPEYQRIEANEPKDPVERDAYYRQLALEQIRREPVKQAALSVKKFLRFWYYIPQFAWIPTVKTLVIMTPLLLLGVIGLFSLRGDVTGQVAAMMIAGMWALHGLIHTEFRYNFPTLPLLFYLALCGAFFLYRRLFRQSGRA